MQQPVVDGCEDEKGTVTEDSVEHHKEVWAAGSMRSRSDTLKRSTANGAMGQQHNRVRGAENKRRGHGLLKGPEYEGNRAAKTHEMETAERLRCVDKHSRLCRAHHKRSRRHKP